MKTIDAAVARRAFDHAVEHHQQVFGEFFLVKLLGFEITFPPDACRVEFPVLDFMFNPQGSLHGGIIALAMDVSMGHLLNRLQGPGATLEMKVQYLAALRGGRAIATGSVLLRGGSIAFLESRLTDQDGTLAAVATATWKTMSAAARPSAMP